MSNLKLIFRDYAFENANILKIIFGGNVPSKKSNLKRDFYENITGLI